MSVGSGRNDHVEKMDHASRQTRNGNLEKIWSTWIKKFEKNVKKIYIHLIARHHHHHQEDHLGERGVRDIHSYTTHIEICQDAAKSCGG